MGLQRLGTSSGASAEQTQQLVEELDKLSDTANSIRDFTKLKASITETGDALRKAKERMAALGAEVDRTDAPTKKLQSSLARAAAEVEKLTKKQNRQQAELQRTSGALRAAGVDTEKLGDAYADLQEEFSGFSRRAGTAADAMKRTAKDGREAAGGVSALERAAGKSAKSLALIASKLALVSGAATAAVKTLATLSGAALFSGALRSAATLEDALTQVQAVSGATADEMVRMKEAAEAGGAATRFSSLEAAQGLGELARATGSAQAAIATLPATLNLAQAAGLGVADAAQIITTTLTQYGLAADQATRVSDILAKEANTTTDNVTALANALSYAAPLAKQLGLDTEQTVAIIGALADQGYRGERAGTALRNVFTEMQDPASNFAKALRDLGIETSDFSEVIEELSKRGKLGQDALLKLDAAARPAIMSLVSDGGAALRQLDTDLRNAAGTAEETARKMGDNLPGAMEAIKDTFDRTRRSLVEPLLEPLRKELFELSDALEAFAQTPEFEEIKGALKDLFVEGAAAARELLENIDFHQLAVDIRNAVGDAKQTIAELRDSLSEIVDTVVIVGRSFQVVFNAVQAGILLVAGSVTKLAAIMAKLGDIQYGASRKFLEFVGILDKSSVKLDEIAGGLNAVANEFGDRFAKNFDEAIAAAQGLARAATGVDASTRGAGEAADAAGESITQLATITVRASAALDGQAAAATGAAAATKAAAGDMQTSAERVKQAFADLGITSQAELNRASESAKRNFEIIRRAVSDGEATVEDARRAFLRYAQAARAAVADSDASAKGRVDAELSVQAAVLQVTDALGTMGEAGRGAGEQVAAGADKAASSLNSASAAAGQAAANTQKMGEATGEAGAQAGKAAKQVDQVSYSMSGLSEAATRAYASLNSWAGTSAWDDLFNNVTHRIQEQKKALDELNGSLDAQLAHLDPLAGELEALRREYDYLDDATLRGTAERIQRLRDEAKRQQEEADRAREQAESQVREAREAEANTRVEPARALDTPAVSKVEVEFKLPGKNLFASASAAEIEYAERIADLVAPRVLQMIERSRSVSIRGNRR
ncbi:phage tail tape measure protein [Luteimonas mephitis]|uniref:phage tail tape measure protein n=1 Tax=Luteimonas mephitis TaxID=83615 RepID=UPI001B7FE063|nr:phage tail tape measure protein [Luteimonas mephitis]